MKTKNLIITVLILVTCHSSLVTSASADDKTTRDPKTGEIISISRNTASGTEVTRDRRTMIITGTREKIRHADGSFTVITRDPVTRAIIGREDHEKPKK